MPDDKPPNHRLAEVMAAAGATNKKLGRLVRELSETDGGGEPVRSDHVAARRWLDGVQPQPRTCRLIARALSTLLARAVTLDEIGYGHVGEQDYTAAYPATVSDSITALGQLTNQNAPSVAAGALTVVPELWGSVLVRWFVDGRGSTENERRAPCTLCQVDVDAVREATVMFGNFDYKFGGGRPKPLVAQYLDSEVMPLLKGADLTTAIGKQYAAEVAALARLAAWTAYDTGAHGMAQRYFVQAFRLAKAAGDRALCGRILAAMSHQANFLGHFDRAVDLARGAHQGAAGAATPTAMALFHAMEARALASVGDAPGVSRALSAAERWHSQSVPANDPSWVRHFDASELHAEFAHCFRDLGQPERAAHHAAASIQESSSLYVRSLSFCRTVLATSHLLSRDLDEALAVARGVVDTAATLKSARVRSYLDDFRTRLIPHQREATVRHFTEYASARLRSIDVPLPR